MKGQVRTNAHRLHISPGSSPNTLILCVEGGDDAQDGHPDCVRVGEAEEVLAKIGVCLIDELKNVISVTSAEAIVSSIALPRLTARVTSPTTSASNHRLSPARMNVALGASPSRRKSADAIHVARSKRPSFAQNQALSREESEEEIELNLSRQALLCGPNGSRPDTAIASNELEIEGYAVSMDEKTCAWLRSLHPGDYIQFKATSGPSKSTSTGLKECETIAIPIVAGLPKSLVPEFPPALAHCFRCSDHEDEEMDSLRCASMKLTSLSHVTHVRLKNLDSYGNPADIRGLKNVKCELRIRYEANGDGNGDGKILSAVSDVHPFRSIEGVNSPSQLPGRRPIRASKAGTTAGSSTVLPPHHPVVSPEAASPHQSKQQSDKATWIKSFAIVGGELSIDIDFAEVSTVCARHFEASTISTAKAIIEIVLSFSEPSVQSLRRSGSDVGKVTFSSSASGTNGNIRRISAPIYECYLDLISPFASMQLAVSDTDGDKASDGGLSSVWIEGATDQLDFQWPCTKPFPSIFVR